MSERLASTLNTKSLIVLISTLQSALTRMTDDWPKMLKSARPVLLQQLESFYSLATRDSEIYESEDESELEPNRTTKKHRGMVDLDSLLPVLESVRKLGDGLVSSAFHTDSEKTMEEKRRELGVLLLGLLGIPLVHCQLVVTEKSSSNIRAVRKFAVDVMGLLCTIRFHAIKIMEFSTQERTVHCSRRDGDEGEYYVSESDDFELPPLACGCFSYLLLVEGINFDSFPTVYHPVYLLRINLPLIEQLIIQSTKPAVDKGLTLLDTLVSKVNKGSIPREILSEKIFLRVAECLIDLMIHNESRRLRKLAICVLPRYLAVFGAYARYKMLVTLLSATDHGGVASLLIYELKQNVVQFVDAVSEGGEPYVNHADIQSLFSSLFSLEDGKSTDILEELDRIMASLNLLRFVLLRDKRETNVTGVWSQIGRIEKKFLDPMRELLHVSKADWQHEVTELQKRCPKEEKGPEVTVCLHGGERLPDLGTKRKGELAHTALISLDMLESVLARVCDIIAMG